MYGPSFDVWISMGADMGVFQVADAPMYGYVHTLPLGSTVKRPINTITKKVSKHKVFLSFSHGT